RAVRSFLRERADAPTRRERDGSGFGGEFAANGSKQGRFAGTIAPDQADPSARRDLHRAVADQKPPGEADRKVRDRKHARLSPLIAPNATAFSHAGRVSTANQPSQQRLPSFDGKSSGSRSMTL